MNLVLFGAGASHASCTSKKPPLAKDLIEALINFAPSTWGTLNETWRSEFQSDFETGMEKFIRSNYFAAPFQWDMAEYFFTQFRSDTDNLYVKLLERMKDKLDRFTLATLNYDLLVTQSFPIVGLKGVVGMQPKDSTEIRCIFPHGSSAIYCKGLTGKGIAFTHGITTGGQPQLFTNHTEFLREKRINVRNDSSRGPRRTNA